MDNTGLIIDSNPHVSLLFNLSEDDLIGKPISDVFGILPNFHPSKIPENGEFTWENHNKLIKHIKFRTRPLLDYNTPVGTMLTFFDISEAKIRMEANVQNAKLSVINKLSAGLAHEIRNPLTTIKGFMQLITPDQWPESFRPYQQLILDEIQSIDKVLNKFVLLTCPPAPKMQQLSLIEIIDATIQLIQPLSLRRGITIQQEYASSVYVMGDREQLLQALLSLLNNAIDASPKKGKIIIQLKKYGTNARISVIDEGPGIPINLRNRVLEPFFTTQTGGTGLGLTIAQQIILAHHGKLHFSESKSLAGTEAMIDLPCLTEFTNNLSA
ncbi:MAG: two-component system sensor histidine kinase NtrB [Desulfosporosinus sp.]